MPTTLKNLRPTKSARVIDLVQEAGMDVSDWANYSGKHPSQNPKYCYEWAYIDPGKQVVLNLWWDMMREQNGSIVIQLNQKQWAEEYGKIPNKGASIKRALYADKALQTAFFEELPVRMIVCDGKRQKEANEEKPSKVEKRSLDPIPWRVTSYDVQTGACVISRGSASSAS